MLVIIFTVIQSLECSTVAGFAMLQKKNIPAPVVF